MQLALELDIPVVMETGTGDAKHDERGHQKLKDTHGHRAGRRRMPAENRYTGAEKHQRNPLRRLVDVAEQDQLADGAEHAERECTEKQSSNCSEGLRLSRGPINHEMNECCGSHYRKDTCRAKLASESQFR